MASHPEPNQQRYADDNVRERLVQEVKRLADVLEERESEQPSATCQLAIKGLIQQSLDNIFSAIRSTNDHVKMLSDSILRIEKDMSEFREAQKKHEEILRGGDGRTGIVQDVATNGHRIKGLESKAGYAIALGMAAVAGVIGAWWKLFVNHLMGGGQP